MLRLLLRALLLAGALSLGGSAVPTRTLTFEDRVRAQEAIERVYHTHRTGASEPFEQAVARSLLQKLLLRAGGAQREAPRLGRRISPSRS